MLQVALDKIMPVTEARANIAHLVDSVERGSIYVLTRGGKPAAVMVPVSKAEKILSKPVQKTAVVQNQPKTLEPVPISTQNKSEELVKNDANDSNDVEDENPSDLDMKKIQEELAKYKQR